MRRRSDIVEYIARGQIKTLACYDVSPSLSIGQIYKAADWYEKTQKFQRAVAKGDGELEDKVNAFFKELAEPYEDDAAATPSSTRMWAASGSTRMSPNTSNELSKRRLSALRVSESFMSIHGTTCASRYAGSDSR